MTTEIKQQITDALNAFLVTHKMTASDVSKRTNVNQAYVSQIRAGKYTTMVGDNEVEIAQKYFERIASFIGFQIDKTYWDTIPTPQFTGIIAILEDAKKFGETTLVVGSTGCGKSYTAQVFAKANPKDTFIVTVGSTDNIGDLIDKMCEVLHIDATRTRSKKLRTIISVVRSLKQTGHSPMLIFDEAEYMKLNALCAMKELYDNLHGVAAIVMMGTDQLVLNIEKLRRKNKEGIPQLYRRIKFGIRTLPTIDKSFKQFINTLEPGLQRFLKTNCDNYGELHDVLVPVYREAERLGQEPTESLVRTVLGIRN